MRKIFGIVLAASIAVPLAMTGANARGFLSNPALREQIQGNPGGAGPSSSPMSNPGSGFRGGPGGAGVSGGPGGGSGGLMDARGPGRDGSRGDGFRGDGFRGGRYDGRGDFYRGGYRSNFFFGTGFGYGPGFGYYDPFWGPNLFSYGAFGGAYGYPYYYDTFYRPYVPPRTVVRYVERPADYLTPPMGPAPEANWYHCNSPDGYYPYVRECDGAWEMVPVKPDQAPPQN